MHKHREFVQEHSIKSGEPRFGQLSAPRSSMVAGSGAPMAWKTHARDTLALSPHPAPAMSRREAR